MVIEGQMKKSILTEPTVIGGGLFHQLYERKIPTSGEVIVRRYAKLRKNWIKLANIYFGLLDN